jgi:hypothetical protein
MRVTAFTCASSIRVRSQTQRPRKPWRAASATQPARRDLRVA